MLGKLEREISETMQLADEAGDLIDPWVNAIIAQLVIYIERLESRLDSLELADLESRVDELEDRLDSGDLE